jgi:hypothetical protein
MNSDRDYFCVKQAIFAKFHYTIIFLLVQATACPVALMHTAYSFTDIFFLAWTNQLLHGRITFVLAFP